MNVLLDTHFLLWIVLDAPSIDGYRWLDRYRPWGVSPISLLEVQFLAEVGKLELRQPDFTDAVGADPRFVVDEVPLVALVRQALSIAWTRDPFDRLLAAHSAARRVPLCTLDRRMRREHAMIVAELTVPPTLGVGAEPLRPAARLPPEAGRAPLGARSSRLPASHA